MAHHRKHSTLVSCLPQVFDNIEWLQIIGSAVGYPGQPF